MPKKYDDLAVLRALQNPEGETEFFGLMWSEYVSNLEIIYHSLHSQWKSSDEENRWTLEQIATNFYPDAIKYIRAITHSEYTDLGVYVQETIRALKSEYEVEPLTLITPSDMFVIGITFAGLLGLYHGIMTMETE